MTDNSGEESGSGSRTASSAAAISTEGYSNPSESNVATGRQKLNESLRSIVMSRTAYSLFHGFNPDQDESVYWIRDIVETERSSGDRSNNSLPNFTIVPDGEDYDELLGQSFSGFTNEVDITKNMGKRLQKVIDDKHKEKGEITFVEAPIPIEGHEGESKKKAPRLDVACGGKIKGELNAFVEVGLTPRDTPVRAEPQKIDQLFWKKINQAIDYLELLAKFGVNGKDTDGEEYELRADKMKTLLLCVIVTNRARTFGRIAVFACEPKDSTGNWRMALMWRREGKMQVLSQAFGYFISAVKVLTENNFHLPVEGEEWNYMGPNCSKVTISISDSEESHSYVLRAYDNRVRQTSRSPAVYHNWDKIKETTKVVARWNEEGNSSNHTIEFRDERYSQQSIIFRSDGKCGKVEVIAVPFIPGRHTCSSIGEALYLVRFLNEMHAAGFVHGDIRGLNAVFAGEETALIDHDFGGLEGSVTYPPEYATVLGDGGRHIGTAKLVSKQLDVKALRYVLAHIHTLEASDPSPDEMAASFKLPKADSLQEIEGILQKLEKWKIEPTEEYGGFIPNARNNREKQTLEGDVISPNKLVTLPSKRSAPSVVADEE